MVNIKICLGYGPLFLKAVSRSTDKEQREKGK